MVGELLTVADSARLLGISPATLYDWLGRSRRGLLVIRGQRITIEFFQTGPKGQGRIKIALDELDRVRDLLRVRSVAVPVRKSPTRRHAYPGITVALGRPR
jgi:hypothetical protein